MHSRSARGTRAITVAAIVLATAPRAHSHSRRRHCSPAAGPAAIAGLYIVVLKSAVRALLPPTASRAARGRGGCVHRQYRRAISETQLSATWGLDRIDQPRLPLNQTYNYLPRARA